MSNSIHRRLEEEPLISIIIPVYNVQDYLERCLQSVSDQDFPNFEVLLIDDGSTDQSGKICDLWANTNCRFSVYHKTNSGLSEARNYGIDRCKGDYICFIDSDDYLEPTCLSYLYRLITKKKECKVAQANHNIVYGNKKKKNYNGGQDFFLTQHDAAEAVLFHDRVDVSAWGKLFHISVFDDLRYPRGKLFEDTYIFGNILQKTENYAYGHIPQYNYVKNPESIVNQDFSEKTLDYIEAAEKMTSEIQKIYPDLKTGCIRRVNHSRLSVLRYMENCSEQYKVKRQELRQQVLSESKYYINHLKTPRRDKVAVFLLRMGFKPFYLGWRIYHNSRNG